MIDLLSALLLTALLASSTGWFFAERAVTTFRVYSPDTIWNGPVPLVLGAVSPLSYGFAFALVVVLVCEGIWGASAGKSALGIRVTCSRGRTVSRRRLLARMVLKTSPWWMFCLALLAGSWEVVVGSLLLLALMVVDSGAAAVFRQRPGYDRLTKTRLTVTDHSSQTMR